MEITAKNLDEVLEDSANIILVRPVPDGTPMTYRLQPTETVGYTPAVTYNTAEEVISHVTDMLDNSVALIRKYPNRQTQRYVVRYGEVL